MLYHDSHQLYLNEDTQYQFKRNLQVINTQSFDDKNEYRDAHGHDNRHEHGQVVHDIEDDDDSHEFQHDLPLIEDKPWGEIYDQPRVICLVPTLWPKKKFVMEVKYEINIYRLR